MRTLTVDRLNAEIEGAAIEILETMFFEYAERVEPGSDTNASATDIWIGSGLQFRGEITGWFRARVSESAAIAIAHGFLGGEADDRSEVEQVVCELTNVLCGLVLSRLEPALAFTLESPEVLSDGDAASLRGPSRVRLNSGTLEAGFYAD